MGEARGSGQVHSEGKKGGLWFGQERLIAERKKGEGQVEGSQMGSQ